MVFSSTLFVFCFLPITLSLYFLAYRLKSIRIANVVLLMASMVFYTWGGIKYFIILVILIIINYFFTLAMEKHRRISIIFFVMALIVDFGNLFYFKYFNFFSENIYNLGKAVGVDLFSEVVTITLPIGISFYTFQVVSYVADVYKNKVKVQTSLVKLMLYVVMFPQLIAGPIVRYKEVSNEIDSRIIGLQDVEEGIKRFIIGFFKKVFLANTMGEMADIIFAIYGSMNSLYTWLGAICYTLQIYYDFSAYSDMAIGMGRIFGFHFSENFDLPYNSLSIQEFWRKWHISLSSWFRDYVYIPLGGNRKGTMRTYLNLTIVFLLTGFWHGAAWQFIIWGIYHGFFLILERLGLYRCLKKLPVTLRRGYTMLIVIIGWVFFRAESIELAIRYLKNMFSFNFTNFKCYEVVQHLTSLFWGCFIIALVFSFTRLEKIKMLRWWNNVTFIRIRYLALWVISLLYLVGLSYNPFIYFKF